MEKTIGQIRTRYSSCLRTIKILFTFFLLILMACSSTKKNASVPQVDEKVKLMKYTSVTVIDRKEIAGCDFVFQLEDESLLEPVNLPDSVRINGMKLWLLFHPIKDRVSSCMSGKIIFIDDLITRTK